MKTRNKSGLTDKQTRFVQEYLVDLNATQAAIRAGYSARTAEVQGPRLLGNVRVAAAISEGQNKTADKLEITKEKWVAELARIFFADMQDYISIDPDTGCVVAKGYEDMPEGGGKVIASIREKRSIKEDSSGKDSVIYSQYEFKLHDKLRAGEMLGKHLGFLKEKVEGNLKLQVELSYEQAREVEQTLAKESRDPK